MQTQMLAPHRRRQGMKGAGRHNGNMQETARNIRKRAKTEEEGSSWAVVGRKGAVCVFAWGGQHPLKVWVVQHPRRRCYGEERADHSEEVGVGREREMLGLQ